MIIMNDKLTEAVTALKNGDLNAFETVYAECAKQVYFLALKVVENKETAEDITQDVFLSVYGKISGLREPQTFPAWLNKITVNKCTDFLRKNNYVSVDVDVEETAESEFVEDSDRRLIPDETLENSETARMITEIIDKLPLPQRVCVYYYYYEQLSVKEIAEQLSVKETTVKTRLAIAREKIRIELEKLEDTEGLKLYNAFPLLLMAVLKTAADGVELPVAIAEKVLTSIASTAGTATTAATSSAGTATTTTVSASGTVSTATTATGGVIKVAVAVAVLVGGIALLTDNNNEDIADVAVDFTMSETSGTSIAETEQNSAQTSNSDFEYEYDSEIDGIVITGYIGDKKEVVIPDKIDGEIVKKLEGKKVIINGTDDEYVIGVFFYSPVKITSVTIPDSVTIIGDNTFFACTQLTDITIPDSVTIIGNNAFGDCKSLESIIIPNSVTSIGKLAFSGCRFSKMELPDSVISIGKEAFPPYTDNTYMRVTYKGKSYFSEVSSHSTLPSWVRKAVHVDEFGYIINEDEVLLFNDLYDIINGQNNGD